MELRIALASLMACLILNLWGEQSLSNYSRMVLMSTIKMVYPKVIEAKKMEQKWNRS